MNHKWQEQGPTNRRPRLMGVAVLLSLWMAFPSEASAQSSQPGSDNPNSDSPSSAFPLPAEEAAPGATWEEGEAPSPNPAPSVPVETAPPTTQPPPPAGQGGSAPRSAAPYPYPPAQGYPPAYGHPQAYPPPYPAPAPYPPPTAYPAYPPPAPIPVPHAPDHYAAHGTPFANFLLGSTLINDRYSSVFTAGVEFGVFIGGRVRLAGRVIATPDPDVNTDNTNLVDGFYGRDPKRPSALLGGSLGIAAVSTRHFVLSPSVYFWRADVGSYGSVAAIGAPFEWVIDSGLRVGFDVGFTYAFGGDFAAECTYGANCTQGERISIDRATSGGFFSNFMLGFAFDKPDLVLPGSAAKAQETEASTP